MLRKLTKKRAENADRAERQEPFLGPTRAGGSMGEKRGPRQSRVAAVWRLLVRERRNVATTVAAVALLAVFWGGYAWLLRSRTFELKEVAVLGVLKHLKKADLLESAHGARGNFFLLDLARIKREVESVPWVKRASVRRVWPDRIVIQVEERVPLARWGDGELLDVGGELFGAEYAGELPTLIGPRGSERELAQRLEEFRGQLAVVGRRPMAIMESDRNAWTVKLDDGTTIQLGRELATDRLRRFVANYDETVARVAGRGITVDMRYRNGFSLRVADRGRAPANRDRQGP